LYGKKRVAIISCTWYQNGAGRIIFIKGHVTNGYGSSGAKCFVDGYFRGFFYSNNSGIITHFRRKITEFLLEQSYEIRPDKCLMNIVKRRRRERVSTDSKNQVLARNNGKSFCKVWSSGKC